jgi:hypothetical protein
MNGVIIVVCTDSGDYVIGDHLGFGPDDIPTFTDWIVGETAEVREAHKQIEFDFASCA